MRVHPARYISAVKLFRVAAGSGLKAVADRVHPSFDLLFACRDRRIPARPLRRSELSPPSRSVPVVLSSQRRRQLLPYSGTNNTAPLPSAAPVATAAACRARARARARCLRHLGVNSVDAERSAEHECDRNRGDHAAPPFPVPRFAAAGRGRSPVRARPATRGSGRFALDVRAQGTIDGHGCDQCNSAHCGSRETGPANLNPILTKGARAGINAGLLMQPRTDRVAPIARSTPPACDTDARSRGREPASPPPVR